ncbi:MAG: L-serine ammonia-lyase, iron-sulfur-dependent subunit beta [Acidobacteria bacterium]|nr:L-serine ammonia-lyase, iron-sulfur-dependent subunit beta [Acidobacteriota bacterium]MBV9477025.1 L-serine ammonia-lyase, iron-sulfur-dependent subunit beta [Acidobacteriota bacterium]
MPIRHDRKVSILDVMGPVMVGPSSSHTAGTARLGRVAREILDEDPLEVHFHLHPPLAATYRGHGSDFALVGGAIGLNVDDPRIPEAIRIAEQMGVKIEFAEEDLGEVHPNTVRVEIRGPNREAEIVGSSIGGGVIEVFKINGFQTRFKGDSPTLLLFYRDRPRMIAEVTGIIGDEVINIASLYCSRKQRGKDAFMQIDVDSPISAAALARIRAMADVAEARYLDRIP